MTRCTQLTLPVASDDPAEIAGRADLPSYGVLCIASQNRVPRMVRKLDLLETFELTARTLEGGNTTLRR